MINNRQAGRRRGRGGGQRPGGNPGNPQGGNRIDNRARGNAAQLLEKYKSLAADAQRSGDRVNTEYYLQFADHYFRVLSEQRGRFEEQNQQRRGREDSFDDDDGDEFESEGRDDRQDRADNREQRNERQDRNDNRQDRDDRQQRRPYAQSDRQGERANGRANGFDRDDRPRQDEGERVDGLTPQPMATAGANGRDGGETGNEVEAPRRRGRPPRNRQPEAADEVAPAFDADRLPPALSRPESSNDDAEDAARPRRRRARPDEDEPSQSAA